MLSSSFGITDDMALWFRNADGEKRKLLFSVGAAFLTRIPGAVGLIWFLPLLRVSLGTDNYANLMSAMALGGAASFLSGGFHLVGRRLVGEAYADRDCSREADAFISTVVVNVLALIIALAMIGGYCALAQVSIGYVIVAMISTAGMTFQMLDNLRSAYNENYVTSILLIILQSTAYAIGFALPETRAYIVIASLIVTGPYTLTSIVTGALLLHDKMYILSGRPIAVMLVARQGIMLGIADGFLFATLSLSVVWLQMTASADTAAWFATVIRLFQTFMIPITLLMLPLSSYIRIRWNSKSVAQQKKYTKVTLSLGVAYGAVTALGLSIASRFYVGRMLHFLVPGDVSIFFLFGAIIAYKSYSSLAYVVLNETIHLSTWMTVAVAMAVTVGAAASLAVEPLGAIDFYALSATASILTVMLWNVARFVRSSMVSA